MLSGYTAAYLRIMLFWIQRFLNILVGIVKENIPLVLDLDSSNIYDAHEAQFGLKYQVVLLCCYSDHQGERDKGFLMAFSFMRCMLDKSSELKVSSASHC